VSNIIKSYYQAAVPDTYTVFGIRLKPFSLGHTLLMKKHDLPWVSENKEAPSAWGLIFGVFICSQSWAEFNDWMKEPNEWEKCNDKGLPLHPIKYRFANYLKKHDKFYKIIPLQKWYYNKWENDIRDFTFNLAKEANKAKHFNFMEKMGDFSNYIKESSKVPRFFLKEGKEQNNTEENPDAWIENILVTLMSKMNYTREQALNAPLSQAIFDYLKYSEEQDAITFGSGADEIEEMLEKNKGLLHANA
jgi:hypothetical protein